MSKGDHVVVGSGLTAWTAALDLARGPHRVMVVEPFPDRTPALQALMGHHALGPEPYPHVVAKEGHEAARALWEVYREEGEALRSLAHSLGQARAVRAQGGFLLAASRAEAAVLAEADDALREDGFSGEFLDHFMLEVRFGLSGPAGAYWAADEAGYDGAALVAAVVAAAEEAGARRSRGLRVLEASARDVRVVTDTDEARFAAALLAPEPAEAGHPAFDVWLPGREQETVRVAHAKAEALPSPARASDGDSGWHAHGRGLVAWHTVGTPASPWSLGDAGPGELLGVARPRDRRPVVGGLVGGLFVAWGGHGPSSACPVLTARWAVEALVAGRETPVAAFRASRFSAT
jgi:hypothetical protein